MTKTKEAGKKKTRLHYYYKCPRCGYVTIVKDSVCPICLKEGVKIKVQIQE